MGATTVSWACQTPLLLLLWGGVDDPSERRRLLLTVLDAVYVDVRDAKAVVSIRPKAAFEVVVGVLPAPSLATSG